MALQAPLGRGTGFNNTLKTPSNWTQAFQSPLGRGIRFNLGQHHRQRSHGHISVPYWSGNKLLPLAIIMPIERVVISVPSWSGNTLQRPPTCRSVSFRCSFSPLLVGESASTCNRSVVCQFVRRVSVPSWSGNPLQHVVRCRPVELNEVSVPSWSGNPLQHHRPYLSWRGEYVSVPSWSGNPLQPASDDNPTLEGSSFSPLLVGESASTAGRLQSSGLAVSFSPLLVGESASTRPGRGVACP